MASNMADVAEIIDLTDVAQVADARIVRVPLGLGRGHVVRTVLYGTSSDPTTTTTTTTTNGTLLVDGPSASLHTALNETFAALVEEVAPYYDHLSSPASSSASTLTGLSASSALTTYEDQIVLDPLDSVLVSVLRGPMQERRTREHQFALLAGESSGGGALLSSARNGNAQLDDGGRHLAKKQRSHVAPTTTATLGAEDVNNTDDIINNMLLISHAYTTHMQQGTQLGLSPSGSSVARAPLVLVGEGVHLAPLTQLDSSETRRRRECGLDCLPQHVGGDLTTEQYIDMMADYISMLDVSPVAGVARYHAMTAAPAATGTIAEGDMRDNDMVHFGPGSHLDQNTRKLYVQERLACVDLLRPKARLRRVDYSAAKAAATAAAGSSTTSGHFVDLRCATLIQASELMLDALPLVVNGRTAFYTIAVSPNLQENHRRATTDWTMSLTMRRLGDTIGVGNKLFCVVQPETVPTTMPTGGSSSSSSTTTTAATTPSSTSSTTTVLLGLPHFDFCDFVDQETFRDLRAQLVEACETAGRRQVADSPIVMIRQNAVVRSPQLIYQSKDAWADQWRLILWRFARLLTMTPLRHDRAQISTGVASAAAAAVAPDAAAAAIEDEPTLSPAFLKKMGALGVMRRRYEHWATLLINMLDSYMRQAYACIVHGGSGGGVDNNNDPGANAPVAVLAVTRSTVEAALAGSGNMDIMAEENAMLPPSPVAAAAAATSTTITSKKPRFPPLRRRLGDAAAATAMDEDDDQLTPRSGTEHTSDNEAAATAAIVRQKQRGGGSSGGGSTALLTAVTAPYTHTNSSNNNSALAYELAEAHARNVQKLRDILEFATEARFEQPAMLLDCVHSVVNSVCSPDPLEFDNIVSVNRVDLTANRVNNARKSAGMQAFYSTVKAERALVFDSHREAEWRLVCTLPVPLDQNIRERGPPLWEDPSFKTYDVACALGVRRLWRAFHVTLLRHGRRNGVAWALVYLMAHRSLLIRLGMWSTQFDRLAYDRLKMDTKPSSITCSVFSRCANENVINRMLDAVIELAGQLCNRGEIVAEDGSTAAAAVEALLLGGTASAAAAAPDESSAPATPMLLAGSGVSGSASAPVLSAVGFESVQSLARVKLEARRQNTTSTKRKAPATTTTLQHRDVDSNDNDNDDKNKHGRLQLVPPPPSPASLVPSATTASEHEHTVVKAHDVDRTWTMFAEQPRAVFDRLKAHGPPSTLLHPSLAAMGFVRGEDFCDWLLQVARTEWQPATLVPSTVVAASSSSGMSGDVGGKPTSSSLRLSASKAIGALIEWNNFYAYGNPPLRQPNEAAKSAFGLRLLAALLPHDEYERIKGGRANARLVLEYQPNSALRQFLLQDNGQVLRFVNKREHEGMSLVKIRPLHDKEPGTQTRRRHRSTGKSAVSPPTLAAAASSAATEDSIATSTTATAAVSSSSAYFAMTDNTPTAHTDTADEIDCDNKPMMAD